MARTVRDCALMLGVLARPDDRDPSALPHDGRDFLAGIEDGVKGLRLGFSPTLAGARVDPGVAAAVAAAARALAGLGATVEEADPALPPHAEAMLTIWAGAAAMLVAMQPEARRAEIDPGLLAMAEIGRGRTLADWFDADATRMALGRAMAACLRRFDALLTPAMPLPAFPAGRDLSAPGQRTWMDWSPFTWPFNMTGQPAMSVPCGFADGVPVGLQIVGRPFDEAGVLRIARAFEREKPWPLPKLD
jgi:aspartyl-tRNA(Asn)/glutamyl-tRNA(Gln) amidotransferase subunit A